MAAFKGVLLDLGGVVHLADKPLPGSVDAVARIRDAGLAVRFLTNATRSPRATLLDKLAAMGIPAKAEELFTPAMAARQLLEREDLSPHLLIHPHLAEDFEGLSGGERKAVVIGDAAEGFTYEALNAAYRELERGGEFIALANNRNFRATDGELNLDAGAFVAALAFASRREPVVLGKPSADFFAGALESIGCSPGEAVMVGDDVESDVGGAMAAGLLGILVKTGKYRDGDESRIDPPPSHVSCDLAEAADWIIAQ